MSMILLGVTGSIAAYKACEVLRRLRDAGHGVQVVMTPAAAQFVTCFLPAAMICCSFG